MSRLSGSYFVSAFFLSAFFLGASGAAQAQTPDDAGLPSQFFKLGVQHYDAGMMADLITRQDAIVVVLPNFVIAEGSPAPLLSGGPSVTTLGGPNGRPASGPAQAAVPPASNRLPEGVQRIYALRSDNSLVIQTAPGFQYQPFKISPISQKGSTP